MNNKAILLVTIAFLAAGSLLITSGIGTPTVDASGPNCPSKGGSSNTVNPTTSNAVNTNVMPVDVQPTV